MPWGKDHNNLYQLSTYYELIDFYNKIKYKTKDKTIDIDIIEEIINKTNP